LAGLALLFPVDVCFVSFIDNIPGVISSIGSPAAGDVTEIELSAAGAGDDISARLNCCKDREGMDKLGIGSMGKYSMLEKGGEFTIGSMIELEVGTGADDGAAKGDDDGGMLGITPLFAMMP
jgi:hypothetical protein